MVDSLELQNMVAEKWLSLHDSAVQDTDYKSDKEILKEIFDEARTYETQLPSNEEVVAMADSLGLDRYGQIYCTSLT